MKTQLLEDIGQSIEPFLVPSGKNTASISDAAAAAGPEHNRARPSMPRSSTGVWRQKPADDTNAPQVQQPVPEVRIAEEQASRPISAESLIDSDLRPVAPSTATSAADAVPPPPVGPTLGSRARSGAGSAADPLFDFPPRTAAVADAVPRASDESWFQRSGHRYMLWGSCAVVAAMVVQGGWWLYGASKDAGSLAVVASGLKDNPQLERAAKRRAMAAKEFTLLPDGEVRVPPVPPAPSTQAIPPRSAAIPPLVVLEPESADGAKSVPPNAAKPEPAAAATAGPELGQEATKPEQTAQQAPHPTAQRVRRYEREKLATASRSTTVGAERAPRRQTVRPLAVQAESAATRESTMAATLKACRAHGYHAAQCIRRACSVTRYGFVCRGK